MVPLGTTNALLLWTSATLRCFKDVYFLQCSYDWQTLASCEIFRKNKISGLSFSPPWQLLQKTDYKCHDGTCQICICAYIHNTHVSALDIQGYLTGIIYKSMCTHTCVYMGWYTSVTRLHGTMVYTWDDESHYIECHESITPPAAKRLLGSLHVTPIKWVPTPICRCNAILELGFLPALGLPTPLKFCFLALVSLGCDWSITY